MARYRRDFPFSSSPDALLNAVGQYLTTEGYEFTQYEGETVFKKGYGILTGPTFIKVSYLPNFVTVEAWMKYALLPGVYVGEIGLTGFVGAAVKGPLKQRVAQIESMVLEAAAIGNTYAAPTVAAAGAPQNMPAPNDMTCPSCGAAIDASMLFCTNCGQSLAAAQTQPAPAEQPAAAPPTSFAEAETQLLSEDLTCPSCGATNAADATDCTNCGQSLAAAQTQPASAEQPAAAPQQPAYVPPRQSVPPQQPAAPYYPPQGSSYAPAQPPAGQFISKRDYFMQYVPHFAKEVRNVAFLCYVCAGLNALLSIFLNPVGLIDSLLLLGLALGMHLGKSKVCAILILVLACVEMLIGIILVGSPGGVLWLIAGIWAVVIFNRADKQYKNYQLSSAQYNVPPQDPNGQM